MTAYNFGHGHPMAPERMELTARLAGSLGLLDLDHVTVAAPEVASDAELCTVHSPEFVAAVRRVSADPGTPDLERGLGTEDDPAFAGMHEASARLAGGSLLAAAAILDGSAVRAVNFGGGHAPCVPRARERLLHLQRRRPGHPAAARRRRAAGGVHRRRRPPRRRNPEHLLGRSAGADDFPARDGADPVPGHRVRQRDRRAERAGQRRERGTPGRHRRRRLAPGLPRRGAAARRGLRARRSSSASTAATPTGWIR